MLVMTERFGELEIAEEAMIHFPEGILGFEDIHRYVLIEHSRESAIHFLQAIDEPALAFAVMHPNLFRPDYSPELWEEDQNILQWNGEDELQVWAILTVPEDVRELTANLMAPIIINPGKRIGRQVVQGLEYSTRHRLLDELERAKRLVSAKPQAQAQKMRYGTEPHVAEALRETV